MSRRKNKWIDKARRRFVCGLPCVACVAACECQETESQPHHAGDRGMGQQAEEDTVIPLCMKHHDRRSAVSVHVLGKGFWSYFGLDRWECIRLAREAYDQACGRFGEGDRQVSTNA